MARAQAARAPRKGVYRHYKGKLYELIGVARHSETLEELAVYWALYPTRYGRKSLWGRPLKMFIEKVRIDGKMVPRFRFVAGKTTGRVR
jgi:cyclomaltodextrinase / maltogenic alpha-amylase / neopullulanase